MAIADHRGGRNFVETLHKPALHRANNYYERATQPVCAFQHEWKDAKQGDLYWHLKALNFIITHRSRHENASLGWLLILSLIAGSCGKKEPATTAGTNDFAEIKAKAESGDSIAHTTRRKYILALVLSGMRRRRSSGAQGGGSRKCPSAIQRWICYSSGQGVTKNDVEAVKWWRKAAEQITPVLNIVWVPPTPTAKAWRRIRWRR